MNLVKKFMMLITKICKNNNINLINFNMNIFQF